VAVITGFDAGSETQRNGFALDGISSIASHRGWVTDGWAWGSEHGAAELCQVLRIHHRSLAHYRNDISIAHFRGAGVPARNADALLTASIRISTSSGSVASAWQPAYQRAQTCRHVDDNFIAQCGGLAPGQRTLRHGGGISAERGIGLMKPYLASTRGRWKSR
jgi:hypothetical protein